MIAALAFAMLSQFGTPHKVILQDQGAWVIQYTFPYKGANPLTLHPSDFKFKLHSIVSNSHCPEHGYGKVSRIDLDGSSSQMAFGEVTFSADATKKCREKLQFWNEVDKTFVTKSNDAESLRDVIVKPGENLYIKLRLEHLHDIYGSIDPLLGKRSVHITLGESQFDEVWDLQKEQYIAYPKGVAGWGEAPLDRKSEAYFCSAPDSLCLETEIPGNSYFRFPEVKVRYGSKMRLRFTYMIAHGTTSQFRGRIAQYQEGDSIWKPISEGASEEEFKTVGRWVKVERIINIRDTATTMAFDLRLVTPGNEIGEVWIDDISLEPVGAYPAKP